MPLSPPPTHRTQHTTHALVSTPPTYGSAHHPLMSHANAHAARGSLQVSAHVVGAWAIYVARYGAAAFKATLDGIQPGLFGQIMRAIWAEHAGYTQGGARKTVSISTTKLLTETDLIADAATFGRQVGRLARALALADAAVERAPTPPLAATFATHRTALAAAHAAAARDNATIYFEAVPEAAALPACRRAKERMVRAVPPPELASPRATDEGAPAWASPLRGLWGSPA